MQDDGNAVVDYGGVRKTTRVDMVDAKVGDYVLIHAGFAIEVLDKETAQENIRAVQELMESENETS